MGVSYSIFRQRSVDSGSSNDVQVQVLFSLIVPIKYIIFIALYSALISFVVSASLISIGLHASLVVWFCHRIGKLC